MPRNLKKCTIALSVLALAGCASESKSDVESFVERSSYAVGVDIGSTMRLGEAEIDMPSLIQGFSDGYADKELLLTEQEIREVLRAFAADIQQKDAERRAAASESNLAQGEEYLTENGEREGVVTTSTGLQYEVLEQGNGPKPTASDKVSVRYRGTLVDGTEFDGTQDPVTFPVGGVIAGWTEVLQVMHVGSKFRVVIPSSLAYGERGSPPQIGPNAALIFEIELVEIAQQ
ncbi:MAG: FKBP-type peptidyl-prolyl cis-trans isomerase [Gemmatimonadota bacterium]|nr:MAG: FKBP-type peptidyl-prolyl cis-trans isomerase [Gemmatimonadota bacterium]